MAKSASVSGFVLTSKQKGLLTQCHTVLCEVRTASSLEASQLKWVSAFTILCSGFHLTERRRDMIACES